MISYSQAPKFKKSAMFKIPRILEAKTPKSMAVP